MSDEEIREYAATGEPLDKAGAYGIQGQFAAYIERIDGDIITWSDSRYLMCIDS